MTGWYFLAATTNAVLVGFYGVAVSAGAREISWVLAGLAGLGSYALWELGRAQGRRDERRKQDILRGAWK